MDLVRGFTNGCFDCLHEGHRHLLREARKRCDWLSVAVNSDASVRRLKGDSRPIQPEIQRLRALQELREVDEVLLYSEDTPIRLIQKLMPDVIFKGGDYQADDVVGAELARVIIIPRLPGFSTTALLKQCVKG